MKAINQPGKLKKILKRIGLLETKLIILHNKVLRADMSKREKNV